MKEIGTLKKFEKEMNYLAKKDLKELKELCKTFPELSFLIDTKFIRESLLTMWSMGLLSGIKIARLEFFKKNNLSSINTPTF